MCLFSVCMPQSITTRESLHQMIYPIQIVLGVLLDWVHCFLGSNGPSINSIRTV